MPPSSINPLELIASRAWERVTCTTYALSLSFFEAVILDALVRGGTAEALILSDLEGVRASLGELGAQRVGKDYRLEPVSVDGGVFHPKVTVLDAGDDCHLLIGSGNLTFGGWGGNCEVVEHLHPSFAAAAFVDAADFFDKLAANARVRHNARVHCTRTAASLRQAAQGHELRSDIRLLHSLTESIATQLVPLVDDMGGATQLSVVSPFWDQGAAIDQLSASLGLDVVHVHCHRAGTVAGNQGNNWPRRTRVRVVPVRVKSFDEPEARRLHAKAIEIMCSKGRIIVSGSINASKAALGAGHNVEACVVRLQRGRRAGWSVTPAAAPMRTGSEDETDIDSDATGVLSAVLDGRELSGVILSPRMTGRVSISVLQAGVWVTVSTAEVDATGEFRVSAPELEAQSWGAGRVLIAAVDLQKRRAQGFVTVAAFGEVTRRVGSIGRSFFAVISGTDTPRDVAAIMAWFQEDPGRLLTGAKPSGGKATGVDHEEPTAEYVPVDRLGSREPASVEGNEVPGGGERRWKQFVGQLISSLTKADTRLRGGGATRVPAAESDDSDGTEDDESVQAAGEDSRAQQRSYESFEALLVALTRNEASPREVGAALALLRFVCGRLSPNLDDAKRWARAVFRAMTRTGLGDASTAEASACVLALLGANPSEAAYREAREHLLALNVDLLQPAPAVADASGFVDAVPQLRPFDELWSALRAVRTFAEQRGALWKAFAEGTPNSGYLQLEAAVPNEWPTLSAAITSSKARARVLSVRDGEEGCPSCSMNLPPKELSKLRSVGIATATNCCQRILVLQPRGDD